MRTILSSQLSLQITFLFKRIFLLEKQYTNIFFVNKSKNVIFFPSRFSQGGTMDALEKQFPFMEKLLPQVSMYWNTKKRIYQHTKKSVANISSVHLPESFTPTVTCFHRFFPETHPRKVLGLKVSSLLGKEKNCSIGFFVSTKNLPTVSSANMKLFEIVLLYFLVFLLSITFFIIFHEIFSSFGFHFIHP